MNGKDEQQHAGKDTEGREQGADAIGITHVINDSLGRRE